LRASPLFPVIPTKAGIYRALTGRFGAEQDEIQVKRRRRKMRGFLLGLIGALSLAVGLPAMAATPAGLVGVLPAPTSESLPAATHQWCRNGEHWVRGGYAKDGKYHAGHCAPKQSP
jgi:hypothetical protein